MADLLNLLDKMYKYEMDPASTVEDTEQTQFCPQMDGRTDKVKPVYPSTWLSKGYNDKSSHLHSSPHEEGGSMGEQKCGQVLQTKQALLQGLAMTNTEWGTTRVLETGTVVTATRTKKHYRYVFDCENLNENFPDKSRILMHHTIHILLTLANRLFKDSINIINWSDCKQARSNNICPILCQFSVLAH